MARTWMQEADEYAKKYADEIKKQNQYLIDQQNQAKQNALNSIENQRLSAVNALNASKDDVREAAADSAKQANINRMLALKDNQNAMSRAGLSTQGIVGSQVNSINNNYGNNLNSILGQRAKQLKDIDTNINNTNLQYDNSRLNAINQYDQGIADINSQIDTKALNQYNTMYKNYMDQKQQEYADQQAELARQEAIRQYNEQMEYQKQQDAIANSQKWASLNGSNNIQFIDNPTSYAVNTDWWQGELNPDTKYGTFKTVDKNGVRYQPDNVGGSKLSSSGKTVKDLFGTGSVGSTGANIDNQKIWKATTGRYYIWDGSQNKYIDITDYISGNRKLGI